MSADENGLKNYFFDSLRGPQGPFLFCRFLGGGNTDISANLQGRGMPRPQHNGNAKITGHSVVTT